MKNIKTYEQHIGQLSFKEYLNKYLNDTIISKEFDCSYKCLIDLDGIEEFTNLIGLYCYENEITSIKPIKNLTNLIYLSIRINKVTSLDGVENLSKLEKIWLYENKITSLKPLENLTNLEVVSCHHNKITSLKPIENLTKLKKLFCNDNPIDWVDYIDKEGRTYYIKLPKSIKELKSDKFFGIDEYWEFYDQNQPAGLSRKFNF